MKSIMFFIKTLMYIMPILVSVAFLTLMERKTLGYMQFRKGPKVVGPYGLLQPFADALKLFMKETLKPSKASPFLFFFSPFLFMALAMALWALMPSPSSPINMNLSILLILGMSSLSVYSLMGSGWASNSKYSLVGGIRAVAQMMSYEMSMGMIILSVILWSNSFSLKEMKKMQNYMWFSVPFFPLLMMWLVSTLAETNRAPFDLTEGESEMVSGYKVEYAGGPFALFFMAEYANMMFMNLLSVMIFLGGGSPASNMQIMNSLMIFTKTTFLIYWFLWVRASYPRLRYDQLMHLTWKKYLPLSMGILCLSLSIITMTKSGLMFF